MLKQVVAQTGCCGYGSFGGKILRRQRTGQADNAQENQQTALAEDVGGVALLNAHINHTGHN